MWYGILGVAVLCLLALVRLTRHQKREPVVFRPRVPLSPTARDVICGAQREAHALGHVYVGPEHLLLAMTAMPNAARTEVEQLGIPAAELRQRVLDSLAKALSPHANQTILPYTSRAWKVLEEAASDALNTQQSTTGIRQLLVGLLREGGSRAAAELINTGVSLEQLRDGATVYHRVYL